MKKLIVMAALAASLSLAGCDAGPQQMAEQADECLTAANPMECAQFRDAGGDVQQYLVGGLAGAAAGYMIAKMTTPSGPRYYLDRDPGYRGTFRPIDRYERSRTYVTSSSYKPYSVRYNRPVSAMPTKRTVTTTTTTTKKGVFGGQRTTTRTTTTTRSSGWSSRSSSRSSSSYRSSSRRR